MPGKDRLITLQEKVVTRDAFGGDVIDWATTATVWASVGPHGRENTERYRSGEEIEQALRFVTMQIFWRDDVDETMRVVYDDLAWDIEGIEEIGYRRGLRLNCRTEPGRMASAYPLTILAGLSADATPDAAEFTIMFTDGAFTFAAFTDMHILLARLATEPDFVSAVLTDDATELNQIQAFTKQAMTLELNSLAHNVWVSDELLTFADERMLKVA